MRPSWTVVPLLLTLCGCRMLLDGSTIPVVPDRPDVVAPADLQQDVSAALASTPAEDCRKYAALYAVMAEEIRTTDRTLSQIRRDFPRAKTKRGLPETGPLSEITARHFADWSKGSEWTDSIRRDFAAACDQLAAACLKASHAR